MTQYPNDVHVDFSKINYYYYGVRNHFQKKNNIKIITMWNKASNRLHDSQDEGIKTDPSFVAKCSDQIML